MKEKLNKVIEEYKAKTEKYCYKIEIVDGIPGIEDDKIGGTPYLPKGEEYPKDKNGEKMALLIQVNLKQIDLEGYPHEGILEIFTDKYCNWPCDYKIKYFKEGLEYQTELEEVDLENYITTKSLKIKLEKDIEHMPISDYRFSDVILPIMNKYYEGNFKNYMDIYEYFDKNDIDVIEEFYENLNIFGGNIGGYADFTQSDPRENSIKNKEECLVKIDSNLGHGIMIGDSGIIFALISKDDIKNNSFENAIVDWDCC